MKKNMNIRVMIFTALLGAISMILSMISFPLPFAPAFLKFDIAELPALFAGFFLGPLDGCVVVFIKIILKLLIQGTDTAFVGEIMNLLGSFCFVLPTSFIYRWKHTKSGAITGLIISTVAVSIAFVFINAYIAFPLYSTLYGIPLDAIIEMGHSVNSNIDSITTLMIFSVFPFNLMKHGVTAVITYLIYIRVRKMLGSILAPENKYKNVYVQNEGMEKQCMNSGKRKWRL